VGRVVFDCHLAVDLQLLNLIMQDARQTGDSNILARKIQEYDQELEGYIPILMAQAHIHWQLGHFSDVLRIFNQSKEFASEHEIWRLNVAHTHFMMVSAWQLSLASEHHAL
jgi:tetratricopeptide repeat protein 30